MIFVNGVPFSTQSSSSSSKQGGTADMCDSYEQGSDTLVALMEDPTLIAVSNSFKEMPERMVSNGSCLGTATSSKCVYLFQKEYATVYPEHVDSVGTDEATTCVGLVIRNRKDGITSVAHMDSPDIVDIGLKQMLSSFPLHSSDDELDVHLIGGYADTLPNHPNPRTESGSHGKLDGYSLPLCIKIVETLLMRPEKFHIRTLFVLGHNTRTDDEGLRPYFNGFLVQIATGLVFPAIFYRNSRCPDEIVRRIRVSVAYEDPAWSGRLLETYDSQTDQFRIAPCRWTHRQKKIALELQRLSDDEILHTCSTSPLAEDPDFVNNEKRKWEYIINHPHWEETFPLKQPRVFVRTDDGGSWKRC